jgi:hypothetical protein
VRMLNQWMPFVLIVVLTLSGLTFVSQSPAVNAQPAIVGPRFVSPNYDYSIGWQSPWFLVQKDDVDGRDSLVVQDGLSQVSFVASEFGSYDAPTFLDEIISTYTNSPSVSDFRPIVDTGGVDQCESIANLACVFFEYSQLSEGGISIDSSAYIGAHILPDGTELFVVAITDPSLFSSYVSAWPQTSTWIQTSGIPETEADTGTVGAPNWGGVEFNIDSAISEEDSVAVTEGIRLAQKFVASKFGGRVPYELYVTALPIESPLGPTFAGMAVESGIVIYTGSAAWSSSVTPLERIGIVVHEYIHAYQRWFSEGESRRSAAWLEEGLAEYLSVMAMAQMRISDTSDFEALFDHLLWISAPPVSLPQLESPSEFHAHDAGVYQLSYFAVDHLLTDTSTNLTTIDSYYARLREGASFEESFQAAFGLSTQQFYEAFEHVQRTLGTTPLPPDDFILLEGTRIPSPVSLSVAPTVLVRDQQFLFVAHTSPGIVCRLRIVLDRAGASLVDQPTFANGSGELFWLVTLPADTVLNSGTLSASCGGVRDRVEILVAR